MAPSQPIAIFGDWHGNTGWAITALRSAARAGVRTSLHVGDFGLDWPGAKRGRHESKLNGYLESLSLTLIISGGNPDNWETLAKLPVEVDGTSKIRTCIKVLPRGGRTTVEGLIVGGLGGAFSVDLEHRKQGKDWWANEEPTREEAESLTAGGPLDILLTHDAPAGVPLKGDFPVRADLTERAERTRLLLREVVGSTLVPNVFCGHWHQRLIHTIHHPDGRETRVDVLNMENSRLGNGVLVWPDDAGLRIEPLLITGR